jgi:drug/metabolite transporter (DMT)-like permease
VAPSHRDSSAFTGYLCAIAATAIWSGNFIIARGLSDSIPPVSLAFWRWTVAVAVFLPFAVRSLLAERRRLRLHLPYLCLTAVLGVTLFNTLVYFAGHTTTATNLSLIAITFPVFILILSRVFLDEEITLVRSAGILLVAFGVVLLITRGELSRLLNITFAIGDLWMLAASFIFAVYSLLVRRKPQTMSIWAFQLSTFLIGLLFLLPFYLWETAVVPPFDPAPRTLLSIAYVGVFASLVAFLLWNRAILLIGPLQGGDGLLHPAPVLRVRRLGFPWRSRGCPPPYQPGTDSRRHSDGQHRRERPKRPRRARGYESEKRLFHFR